MTNFCLLVILTLKNQYHKPFMNTMPRHRQGKYWFQNSLNPSCIDLFITNSPWSFQNTIAVFNGLSDFHKMVITVVKMSFKKHHSSLERHYRDYKCFDQTTFEIKLREN